MMDGPFPRDTDFDANRPTDVTELTRLSCLDPIAYDREREPAARKLGIRQSTLDAEVQRLRAIGERDAHPEASPPEFADENLALRFSAEHAERLRHVATWGRWLIWDGATWRFDDTLRAFDLARAICRQASAECNDPTVSPSIASAKTVAAIERLAKADRRHATTTDVWDADPWLLNTPGGVVDLRTGRLRQHRAADLITKITAVSPGGPCPLWLAFLERITGRDAELRNYLQRVIGYSLTGSTREHALFFAYGTGANGKGTFLNTVAAVLNDYATVATMETFQASGSDRHPTELAMLRGARLVTAQETEEGRAWAEAKIKALTGGDPITARFMRQDFFTFQPAFKLFIAGNHKPALRNVDEAIRRRFNLIPFAVQIPAAERDGDLPGKLKVEWPGILQWAIEGCLAWQRDGLAAPPAVTAATAEYFETEDGMKAWMDECCDTGNEYADGSTVLYQSFKAWSERAGERPMSQKRFTQVVQARGYGIEHTRSGNRVFGVRLRPSADRSEAREWGE